MSVLSIQHILVSGALLSIAAGVLILGSLYYNPRLWLQDYPAEVRAKVPPNTPAEKRLQRLLVILFLLILLGLPFYSTHLLRVENGGTISFLSAYLNTFFILNLFNLFDAVVLDLLILTFMQPDFAVIPGAEGMGLLNRNWGMHLSNYLKGIVFAALMSIPIALAAMAW